MNRLFPIVCALIALAALSATAQIPTAPITEKSPAAATNLLPILPKPHSPVDYFRQLLAMTPTERNHSLTNRTPEASTRILAKVREYQSLRPDERELRLRATELRWWLTPLLRTPATNRPARLEQVPADLQPLVRSRLALWNILPPQLQQEFLENDKTLHYFARVEGANPPAATAEQLKLSAQFNQFFELTTKEKQQTLDTLSAAERAQMEKTLNTFDQLPAQQRMLCVRNYAKFTGMSAGERAEFLKNADRWSKMSPRERQSWRDLVAHVPLLPPMPPAPVPAGLIPPAHSKLPRPGVATN